MPKRRLPAPATCPVCGEDVPRNALACPECGADHSSGWREEAASIDAIGDREDEDDFNYEEFTEREFGSGKPQIKPKTITWFWWLVATLVSAAIGYFYFEEICSALRLR
jgi:hypothetical protein